MYKAVVQRCLKITKRFKTLHNNMQTEVIKCNLIFVYVKRLNLFYTICTLTGF